MCIIADDLTGASDTGIQYHKAGHSVYLSLSTEHLDVPDDANVVVINNDSRYLNSEKAYNRVFQSAIECKAKGITKFYKKIDSTMRGNIKGEIDALLDALDCPAAIIAPSAPDNKRTVKGGNCFIGEILIHNCESGKDILNPVKSSYIPDHFLSNGINHSVVLRVEDLNKSFSELKKMIEMLISNGYKYIICDAESKNDLKAISVLKNIDNLLLVGSSGLADVLAGEKIKNQDGSILHPVLPEKVLIINGSRMGISRKQTEMIVKNRNVFLVQLYEKNIVNNPVDEMERAQSIVSDTCKEGAFLIQTVAQQDNEEYQSVDIERQLAGSISTFFGQLVRSIYIKKHIEAIIIIGGDTSSKIMKALDVEGVEYLGEVLSGIPFGSLHGSLFNKPIYFISKSGSFGDPKTLEQLFDFITGKNIYGENYV